MHRKAAAAIASKVRQQTKALYNEVFDQLHLSPTVQNKVLDILTAPQRRMQQQALEAAQTGRFAPPPSPDQIRAEQVEQDQQLRSVLGEDGFAALNQYRFTIPDRLIINALNDQGANLSESQSQQLLQVLTEARQQVTGPAAATRYLAQMPPDQAMAIFQQQQQLLQQTVSDRVQNILSPEQTAALKDIMSQSSIVPRPPAPAH
jgi:hypothetical protein